MGFSDETVAKAFDKAGGQCECTRDCEQHAGRCPNILNFALRGRETEGGWEAHHRTASILSDDDSLSNCEILCIECHKHTTSYGRGR